MPSDFDRQRLRIAWVITVVWVLCFPISIRFPEFSGLTWAQPPMLAVVTFLFAAPLLRKTNGNGNGGEK